MIDRITAESQPERYKELVALWISEKKPGWIVTGNTTYQVLVKNSIPEFQPFNAESLYEHTSLH